MNTENMSIKEESHKHYVLAFFFTLIAVTVIGFLKIFFIDEIGLEQFDGIDYAAIAFLHAVLLFAVFTHAYSQRKKIALAGKKVWPLAAIIAISYTVCMACSLINLYAMPLLMSAVLVAALIDPKIAFVTNLIVNLMVLLTLAIEWHYYQATSVFSLLTILVVGAMGAALVVNRIWGYIKRISYFFTLIWVGLVTFGALTAGSLLTTHSFASALEHMPYLLIGIGLQILLSALLQPLLESGFNLLTNQRLVELTDYKQPLLVRLRKEAPGTFNHSLTVANLAETCATAIGENPYMAKAAAFYHDVGKLKNVGFFTENQNSEYNPHDDLMPEVSRDIIINHTTGGLAICKEYRLPDEISRITVEHHGTLPIALFYNKAKQLTDGEVDIEDYKYQGALPSTKIAALIMVCDACEAAIRSINRPTGQKVDNLVKSMINYRLFSGQFDSCDITMEDLHIIRKTIVDAFGGLYHNRISYDKS